MNKILFKALLLSLCLCTFHCPAQKPLTVGDTIPAELWNLPLQVVNHPDGKETITLSEYKDKLIILDFWATWCGACIKKFPETGLIQQTFVDRISFIGLTSDSPTAVEVFTKKYRQNNSERYIPLTVTIPPMFKDIFPHFSIPHYVWISEGKIVAITTPLEVIKKNIKDVLDKKSFALPLKYERTDYRASLPLFIQGNGGEQVESNFYRSLLTGEIYGLQKITSVTKPSSGRKIKKLTCINCTISELFTLVNPEIISWPQSRILTEIQNVKADKVYSYELNTPPTDILKMYSLAEDDFRRYLNAQGVYQEREIDCVVLTAGDSIINSYTKGGIPENNLHTSGEDSFLKNYPLRTLVAHLNNNTKGLLYIDETRCDENLDLTFNEDIDDYQKIKDYLFSQGLILTKEKRKIKVFVINVNSQEHDGTVYR